VKTKRNKLQISAMVAISIIFALHNLCYAETAWINDVWITPEFPIDNDEITISVFGQASYNSSYVIISQFIQNQNELMLDLFIDMGIYTIISDWEHDELIGILEPDNYNLTVRAYDYSDYTLQDEYTTGFTVTPEPSTLLILTFGIAILRTRKQWKK